MYIFPFHQHTTPRPVYNDNNKRAQVISDLSEALGMMCFCIMSRLHRRNISFEFLLASECHQMAMSRVLVMSGWDVWPCMFLFVLRVSKCLIQIAIVASIRNKFT